MPKYPGISPYDNEKGTLGTAKKRWEKLYVKTIESDTVSGINATIENLATTATNSVAAAVSAKNDAVSAKNAAEAAQTAAETAAAGIQSVVETDVDNTLSIAGVAADAKVTGDWLRDIAKPVTLDTSMPATAYAEEYMKVSTDSEGKVLYGVKRDGTFTWQKGTPRHVIEACNPSINNDEYAYVMLDADQRVLFGVKKDGSVDWQKGTPQHVIEACNPSIESREFVQVTQDADGKLIEGIRVDGTKVFSGNVCFKGNVQGLHKLNYLYDKLKGKKVSIIGSSSSTFSGYTDKYLHPYYPAYDVLTVNETWWGKTIDVLDMELLKNVSISASSVTGDSTINENLGPSTAGCSNYRIAELSEKGVSPDIVLIYIGMNDFKKPNLTISHISQGDYVAPEGIINDFAKAYDLMLYKIKSTYPNAMVYCATLPYFKRQSGDEYPFPFKIDGTNCFTMGNEAIREACHHIGAYCVENYNRPWADQTISSTDVHMSKNGMDLMSRSFVKTILDTY